MGFTPQPHPPALSSHRRAGDRLAAGYGQHAQTERRTHEEHAARPHPPAPPKPKVEVPYWSVATAIGLRARASAVLYVSRRLDIVFLQ